MICQSDDERREFLRVDHDQSLNFKVLKDEKLVQKSDINCRNISASGLLFRTSSDSSIPPLSSVVWIALDEKMMNICSEIEEDLVMHNNGIFGRVVRIAEGEPGQSYDIGVCFFRKKDMSPEEIDSLVRSGGK